MIIGLTCSARVGVAHRKKNINSSDKHKYVGCLVGVCKYLLLILRYL